MKRTSILLFIFVSCVLIANARQNETAEKIEEWVKQELSNCVHDGEQLGQNPLSRKTEMFAMRLPLEHPNGWWYPAGSSNYCGYLGWLGFNSAFNGYHLAQDMCNPLADPVYSIDVGDVIYSSTTVCGYGGSSGAVCDQNGNRYGGALVIQHRAKDGTWFTALYGHLDSPLPVNSHVYAGDYVGYSNNWNPPHVHFGIRPGYNPSISDGNYYRGYTSSTGNVYGFTNPTTFLSDEQACKNGSSVNFRPNGGRPVHPNGTLIKNSTSSTVYLVRNNQKQGIATATVLRNLYPNGGFDFKDVITIAQDEFDNYAVGTTITNQLPSNGRTHSEGRVIRRSTGGEVSIVTDNGMRRPFVSEGVLLGLGYLWCNVVDATNSNYDSYPEGAAITGLPTGQNYTITLSASPAAGGTVGGSGTFPSGSSRTVTATANSGYAFSNWTENGNVVSPSSSYTFTLNTNRTLVANFTTTQVNYTITLSSSPTAGGTVNGGGTFPSGSSRTVTATANSGYTFANWTESGNPVSSSASYTFTLNNNRTLVANFTQNPTCPSPAPIISGQTVNGMLQAGDCLYSDGSYYDGFSFSGTAGQEIYVTLNSTQFDAFLFLFQGNYPGGSQLASNNDGGGGTNARIPATSGFLTLPVTGTYTILANSLAAGETGSYSLHLGSNSAPTNRKAFDFDGDGKTDIGIFRPTGGASEWWINRSSTGVTFALQFGASTDKIAPADYTGDGKSDIAFWRPSDGKWYVLRSEDFSFFAFPFGSSGDIPVPADYDADGKADAAVFRPATATWFISQSSGAPTRIFQFGANGDQPVAADYDGDGKTDVGIFRPQPREWWIQRSTAGLLAMQFGNTGDKAVQGDYTGDGKADVALWRPSTGAWFIVRSEDLSFYGFPFGASTDILAPGDYDGDGKFDPTVFRPSNATWFIARTTAGTQIVQFGATGDRPIPNAYVP